MKTTQDPAEYKLNFFICNIFQFYVHNNGCVVSYSIVKSAMQQYILSEVRRPLPRPLAVPVLVSTVYNVQWPYPISRIIRQSKSPLSSYRRPAWEEQDLVG